VADSRLHRTAWNRALSALSGVTILPLLAGSAVDAHLEGASGDAAVGFVLTAAVIIAVVRSWRTGLRVHPDRVDVVGELRTQSLDRHSLAGVSIAGGWNGQPVARLHTTDGRTRDVGGLMTGRVTRGYRQRLAALATELGVA
jgi:hypothetical protein